MSRISIIFFLLLPHGVFADDPLAERDATITRIVRANGEFTFDNKKTIRPPITLQFLQNPNFPATHADLRRDIGTLQTLEAVRFSYADDDDLKMLGSLPRIRELVVSGDFTDLGVKSLGAAVSLRLLSVQSKEITNDCLSVFEKLPQLAALDLSGNQLDDRGLKLLQKCRTLRALNLSGTSVDGSGFADLKSLRLEKVALSSKLIDDTSIASLVVCTEIQTLILHSVAVTDVGLRHIERMRDLRQLTIQGSSSLTAEGFQSLRRKKPRLAVTKS